MVLQFPCLICEKAVAKNHKAVCCDVFNKWVHVTSNNINTYTYRKLKKSDTPCTVTIITGYLKEKK